MDVKLIIYPAFFMVLLTFILYIINYLENKNSYKNKQLSEKYFKAYQGDVPENVTVSRQTLKNQFELPILFYFLISILIAFNNIAILDIVFAWVFVISRYIHTYIRLTTNYIPYRAKIFQLGMLILTIWWLHFIIKISL